jgi:hypothetical protein
MGTDHLHGREPWFWVSADRTLHLQVKACPDGFVIGENEANARLIAQAPTMHDLLLRLADAIEALDGTSVENEKLVDDYRAWHAQSTLQPADVRADQPLSES